MKLKNSLALGFLLLLSLSHRLSSPITVNAETFSSTNYLIEMGHINVTSGKKSSTTYQLTDSVGQIAPGRFQSTGYVVRSGFQYIYDTFREFSFSIDDIDINLGTPSPNVGTTDTNIVTVSTPYGTGYQITASENHPLANLSGQTIPDTGCDSGTCTETTSGLWTGNSAYGFGFNVIGIDSSGVATGIGTSDYFANNTYFRQFANRSASPAEDPQIVMSESIHVENRRARVSYKVVISAIQPSGDYQNAITFTAIPQY